jgi:L-fuconolactonase
MSMPDFPIIDSHLHIYDPGLISFPWMKARPSLDSPHLPETFFAAVDSVQVEGAVFVEVDAAPGFNLREAEFVTRQASREPRLAGMVASVALDSGPEAAAADLKTLAGMPLARGVRQLIERHVDEPGWAVRQPFVEGVQCLAAYDMSFDLCLYHPQLRDAIELVGRCPQVKFVLDHIGKPGIKAGLTEPWRTDLRTLAGLPNVMCKISGVVTEADHARWTEAEISPYIEHAIDCFGYDRVMFGGDWPVSELATSYASWVGLVDRITATASAADRRKLFRDNAIAFYRLKPMRQDRADGHLSEE